MHKTQNSQTYFFHKFILLKDFFKKKEIPLFWVRLALFIDFWFRGVGKKFLFGSPFFEMLSYAPILWIFLSLLFFFKLACSLFRNSIVFYVLFLYVQVVLCCTVHRVIIRRYFFITSSTFILHHISRQSTQQSSHDGI